MGSRIQIIEVRIQNGRIEPVGSQSLPETGGGFLALLAGDSDNSGAGISIATEADGLPVIRTQGGVITAGMVDWIERFAN